MADQKPKEQPKQGEHHPSLASTAHAVRFTQGWKPTFARRQSWAAEDRKRDSQMRVMGGRLPEGYSQVSERAKDV